MNAAERDAGVDPPGTPGRVHLATAGESMALLVQNGPGRLRHARHLALRVGGAESNVAIATARLGLPSRWVSRVGDDELGHLVHAAVAGEHVDTAGVVRAPGERTGLYLRDEAGGTVRAHYYRDGSAASRLAPEAVEPALLTRAEVLHLTGITPALSPECAEFTRWAAGLAHRAGVTVSFDVNYREKLWSPTAARDFVTALASVIDVLFTSDEEAEALWGGADPAAIAGALGTGGTTELIVKHGPAGATHFHDGRTRTAEGFPVARVVDPIGAGDAFAAGYLAARAWTDDVHQRLRAGNAMGAWCVGSAGDYEGLPDRRELLAFLDSRKQLGR